MHKPQTISKYKKEKTRRVGEGGTGEIYTAVNTLTGETVIIKQVKVNNSDEGLAISGLRESYILSSCRHENIIGIIETYYWQKNITLVLELCERDIGAVLSDGYTIPKEARQSIFFMTLRGLHYLHGKWILHRDIKLSNILVAHDGTIKLTDFGLSRYYKYNGFDTGNVGTQTYRAPEIILQGRQSMPTSDVWSMGICFCEMIFGCDGSNYTFYDVVKCELDTMVSNPNCKGHKIACSRQLTSSIEKSHGDVRDTTMFTILGRALGYPSRKEREDLPQTAILSSIFPVEMCVTEESLSGTCEDADKCSEQKDGEGSLTTSNTANSHMYKPLASILEKYGASDAEIDLILKMLNWSPYMRYTSEQCLMHPLFTSIFDSSSVATNRKETLEACLSHGTLDVKKYTLSTFPQNNPLTQRQTANNISISIPCLNATRVPVRDMDDLSQTYTAQMDVPRGDLSYSFLIGASSLMDGPTSPHHSDSRNQELFSLAKQQALAPAPALRNCGWDDSDDSSELRQSKLHGHPEHDPAEKDDPVLLGMVKSLSLSRSEGCLQELSQSHTTPFGCSQRMQQLSIRHTATSALKTFPLVSPDNSWDDVC